MAPGDRSVPPAGRRTTGMLALVLLLSVTLFGTISVSVRNAGIRRTDTTTASTTRMVMARQPTATAPQIAPHDMEATLRWMLQHPDPVVKAAAVRLEQERRRQLEKERGPDACERVSWGRDDGRRHDVGMCLVLKNDAKILDEYIAFHWVQGAAHFVIFDDSSDDDPWSVLEKYAALGIVDFHDMRGHPDNSTLHLQLKLLNRCFTDLRARREDLGLNWATFGDSDEYYLSSNPGQTLTELLNSKYHDSQCLHFQRTLYGSSYYIEPPRQGALITETYVLAGKDHGQSHAKVIANLQSDNVTELKNVHRFNDDQHVHCVPKEEVTDVRINHYLRSLRDYDVKVLTYFKRASLYVNEPPLKRFFERDLNEYHSPVAAEYACSVRGLIQDIQGRWDNGTLAPVPRPKPWSETADGLAHYGWLRKKAQAEEERRKKEKA